MYTVSYTTQLIRYHKRHGSLTLNYNALTFFLLNYFCGFASLFQMKKIVTQCSFVQTADFRGDTVSLRKKSFFCFIKMIPIDKLSNWCRYKSLHQRQKKIKPSLFLDQKESKQIIKCQLLISIQLKLNNCLVIFLKFRNEIQLIYVSAIMI